MTRDDIEKRSPSVCWAQRKNLIYLTIEVTDCKKPDLKLDTNKLYFKGKNQEGMQYEATLNLFKDVNVQASRHNITGRGIDFVLIKNQDGFWGKLLKDDKKPHWLHIDFSRWKDEDDSDVEVEDEEAFEEGSDDED